MQTQCSTSTQPSFDSLSSSDSLLFSDSEQAEDDTDVFQVERSHSVIIGNVGVARGQEVEGVKSPGSQWDAFTSRVEVELEGSEGAKIKPRVEKGEQERENTEGNLLFTQKCAELQGFIRPLLDLLHGLKKGRFDRGLSTFQQSVAMDRIQRIVGVLQRPNGSEKHLETLLQVERMLKAWFPQVSLPAPPPPSAPAPVETPASQGVPPGGNPPLRQRDQRHIPVKKRRLSWTDSDSPTPPPTLLKQLCTRGGEEGGSQGEDKGESPPLPVAGGELRDVQDLAHASPEGDEKKGKKEGSREREEETSSNRASGWSEPSLTWVHAAPISSPTKACSSHKGKAADEKRKQMMPVTLFSTSRGSPATQDSSISSTTPYDSQNQQQPIGCQSQPVAGLQTESMALDTCSWRSQFSGTTVKPLTRAVPKDRVCSAPSET